LDASAETSIFAQKIWCHNLRTRYVVGENFAWSHYLWFISFLPSLSAVCYIWRFFLERLWTGKFCDKSRWEPNTRISGLVFSWRLLVYRNMDSCFGRKDIQTSGNIVCNRGCWSWRGN
jgi:hypothetical protein